MRKKASQERRPRRLQGRSSDEAFSHAVMLLNRCNVEHIWKLSALLSLHETYFLSRSGSDFIATLHFHKVRLFGEAILQSTAASGGQKQLGLRDLIDILDDFVVGTGEEGALAELEKSNNTDRAPLEFSRFVTRLAAVQLEEQEPRIHLRLGRLIAMFEVLPRERTDWIPVSHRSKVEEVLEKIPTLLGVPLRDLIRAAFFLHVLIATKYKNLAHHLPVVPSREDSTPEQRATSARSLLEKLLWFAKDDDLVFTPEGVEEASGGRVDANAVRALLALLGRSTEDLRRERGEKEVYGLDSPGMSLSIVERFSIVLLPDTAAGQKQFLIPNVRFFAKSLPRALDYALQGQLGEDYDQARGALQEVYLRALLHDRLKPDLLIPEREYGSKRSRKRGPDLTMIERSDTGPILVESKGRRILAKTRHLLREEDFNENLQSAFAALQRLPEKYTALRSGLPEYKDVQSTFDGKGAVDPICIAVLSDSIFAMSEYLRLLVSQSPKHPLRNLPYPYAIVGLDGFERAVELAAASRRSLWEIFGEHWEASGRNLAPPSDFSSADPDQFGGAPFDDSKSFGASFLQSRGGQDEG